MTGLFDHCHAVLLPRTRPVILWKTENTMFIWYKPSHKVDSKFYIRGWFILWSSVSYLVVELGVQSVRLILCFSSFLLSPPLHLRKTVINPGEETSFRQKVYGNQTCICCYIVETDLKSWSTSISFTWSSDNIELITILSNNTINTFNTSAIWNVKRCY